MEYLTKTPIEYGWSGDKKWRVTGENGRSYLLRVSPLARAEDRARMAALQRQAWALGVPTCESLEFGLCAGGVYLLQRWVDGVDAREVLPGLDPAQQRGLGQEAGRLLKLLHTIPAPSDLPAWETQCRAKTEKNLASYFACPVRFSEDAALIRVVQEGLPLLSGRPQCFHHGDYHVGNMMLEQGKLVILDFDRWGYGDPWAEFKRIVWCAELSPAFASGMVDAYFDGAVPDAFWALLRFYLSRGVLGSIPWAIPYGQEEVNTMLRQADELLCWYDGMERLVPSWYEKA